MESESELDAEAHHICPEPADVVQECVRMSPCALEAVQALTEMGCPLLEIMALLPNQSQVSASSPLGVKRPNFT